MVVRVESDMTANVNSPVENVTDPSVSVLPKNAADEFSEILNSLRLPSKLPKVSGVGSEEFRQLLKAQLDIHDHSLKVNLLSRAFDSIGSSVKKLQQMS